MAGGRGPRLTRRTRAPASRSAPALRRPTAPPPTTRPSRPRRSTKRGNISYVRGRERGWGEREPMNQEEESRGQVVGAVLLGAVFARGLAVLGHLLLERVAVDPEPVGRLHRHAVARLQDLLDQLALDPFDHQ